MENVSETIKNFLEANGYKVTEVDEDGIVSVRFQMNIIHICPCKDNPEFMNMMLPNIDEVDEENPLPVMLACMRVVSQQMVVKAFPIGKDNVLASYEFFFRDEEELLYNIEKGLRSLIAAKVQYRKYRTEIDGE